MILCSTQSAFQRRDTAYSFVHMDTTTIARKIEALLFVAGEPLSYARLRDILQVDMNQLEAGLTELGSRLTQGIRLVRAEKVVGLATAPEEADYVTVLLKDPGEKDIGQAGLEVLAIILYEGSCSKASIDYIRGVNSSSTIRTLLYRGLIERIVSGREVTYVPTAELLAHLGSSERGSLPEFERLSKELAAYRARSADDATTEAATPAA